jgi:hypothetical protein
MIPMTDPHGQVALMLCESLLHILVEESVIKKQKALEAINTVVELTREAAEEGDPDVMVGEAMKLAIRIAESFAAKGDCERP